MIQVYNCTFFFFFFWLLLLLVLLLLLLLYYVSHKRASASPEILTEQMLRGKIASICVESVCIVFLEIRRKCLGKCLICPAQAWNEQLPARVSLVLLSVFFFKQLDYTSRQQQQQQQQLFVAVDMFFSFRLSLTLGAVAVTTRFGCHSIGACVCAFLREPWREYKKKKMRVCIVSLAVVVVITSNERLCWCEYWIDVRSYTPRTLFFSWLFTK